MKATKINVVAVAAKDLEEKVDAKTNRPNNEQDFVKNNSIGQVKINEENQRTK